MTVHQGLHIKSLQLFKILLMLEHRFLKSGKGVTVSPDLKYEQICG